MRLIASLAGLGGFWYVGLLASNALHLPLSAGVCGLFLLLAALFSGLIKPDWINGGSTLLLRHLVLFFIPCVVGLINYRALFLSQGWQLLLSIIAGTVCVMVVTAYAVIMGFKLERAIKHRVLYYLRHKQGQNA